MSRRRIYIDMRGPTRIMRAMDADEKEVCNYLKAFGAQFVSGREINRRAGGKWRYRDDPNWATPILLRLVEKGYVESDASGYYRLRPIDKKRKPKKWVSPQIKAILEQSGKDFGEILRVDEQDDFFK
jgi:hypothetical protein